MSQKQRALQLDSEGKCVVCTVESEDRTRGLCTTDYNRFLSAFRQLPTEKRAEFELQLIEHGRILQSRQGQRTGIEDNVFAEELATFLGTAPQTEEQIREAIREAEELERRKAAKIKKERPPRNRRRRKSR